MPESMHLCDTPEKAAEYWRTNIAKNPHFNPDCECLAVLLIVIIHNYPSGEPQPSEADIKVTGDLIRAGRL